MRGVVALAAVLLVAQAGAAKAKSRDDGGEGVDRMRVEIDASGSAADPEAPASQSPEMAAAEAKATSQLHGRYADALQDIMAVLLHGAEQSRDVALQKLIGLAVASGEDGRVQARLLRSAVIAGGALPAIIALLGAGEAQRAHLAAAAVHALALDDPTTDDDNFHQEEICQAGAVPPLVRLLESPEPQTQSVATAALSTLAENPTCQAMSASSSAAARTPRP